MANIIKNLSKSIVAKYPDFHVREDLNFSDDGNRFRGFDYNGLPITTLRSDNMTYLTVRVDYLHTNFTHKEWMETEEFRLEDEFNGVPEVDLDKLIENCERIIAKVEAMNKSAESEDIDMTDVKEKVSARIEEIDAAVSTAKKIDWLMMEDWKLKNIKDYISSLLREKENLEKTDFDALGIREKKEWKNRKLSGGWYVERIYELCK